MALINEEAYDMSLFETELVDIEEKTEDEAAAEKTNKTEQKKKIKKIRFAKSAVVVSVIVFFLGLILIGQVRLTELNDQIAGEQTKLEEQKSLYIQTQMKVESKYSSDVVEESAQNQLGMSRADSYQKEYISLSEGDKAEVAASGGSNIFETIANTIAGLWS